MTRLVLEGVAGKNTTAFCDTLTVGEIGAALLAVSDDGYNVIVGSTADKPSLFNDYSRHPRTRVWLPRLGVWSTAAGRYQFIFSTWQETASKLGLKDFSPVSQDLACIERIRFRGALADVRAGRFADAIHKCRQEWASLPGAGYGQGEVKFAALQARYIAAGGVLV